METRQQYRITTTTAGNVRQRPLTRVLPRPDYKVDWSGADAPRSYRWLGGLTFACALGVALLAVYDLWDVLR